MFKTGEICYYIENRRTVRQGVIMARQADTYTVRISEDGALRLTEGRLYKSYDAAARILPEVLPVPPSIHEPPLH